MSSLPLVVEKALVSQLEVLMAGQGVVDPAIVNFGLVEDYIWTIVRSPRQFFRLNCGIIFSNSIVVCSLTFPG